MDSTNPRLDLVELSLLASSPPPLGLLCLHPSAPPPYTAPLARGARPATVWRPDANPLLRTEERERRQRGKERDRVGAWRIWRGRRRSRRLEREELVGAVVLSLMQGVTWKREKMESFARRSGR